MLDLCRFLQVYQMDLLLELSLCVEGGKNSIGLSCVWISVEDDDNFHAFNIVP